MTSKCSNCGHDEDMHNNIGNETCFDRANKGKISQCNCEKFSPEDEIEFPVDEIVPFNLREKEGVVKSNHMKCKTCGRLKEEIINLIKQRKWVWNEEKFGKKGKEKFNLFVSELIIEVGKLK